MKTIQKFTLGLLTIVASSAGFSSNLIVDVDAGDTATVSSVITGTLQKIDAGTLVMSGANAASLTRLTIDNGRVQYATTGNVGALVHMNANVAAGASAALEVLSGAATVSGTVATIASNSVAVPPLQMSNPAQLQVDANVAASLSAFASSGSTTAAAVSALSLVAQSSTAALAAPALAALGATSVTPFTCRAIAASDLGVSATGVVALVPINVGSGINLQVASGGKLPNALVDVSGQLEIQTATANQCPGTVEIRSAAVLNVLAGIAVPADSPATSDLFGSLKFNSGSTLKLGNGTSWARNITVGTAL